MGNAYRTADRLCTKQLRPIRTEIMSPKAIAATGMTSSGGGIRTPDTRIMIRCSNQLSYAALLLPSGSEPFEIARRVTLLGERQFIRHPPSLQDDRSGFQAEVPSRSWSFAIGIGTPGSRSLSDRRRARLSTRWQARASPLHIHHARILPASGRWTGSNRVRRGYQEFACLTPRDGDRPGLVVRGCLG